MHSVLIGKLLFRHVSALDAGLLQELISFSTRVAYVPICVTEILNILLKL